MKQLVSDLKENTAVASYFVLAEKKSIMAKQDGVNYWFEMILSDKTGRIPARFWGDNNFAKIAELFDSLSINSVVFVEGRVSNYRGLYISVNTNNKLHAATEYDEADLKMVSDIDITQLKSKFIVEIESIQNTPLKSLLNLFFKDKAFLEKFTTWPAAKFHHHAYQSGLLEHVLIMINISKTICQSYPSLDADLIKTGCILHDIGKIAQYEPGLSTTETPDGKSMGHISLGVLLVSEKFKIFLYDVMQFNNDLVRLLLHIILSHHGRLKYGSPVIPQTPEAWAVHLVDMCDAFVNHEVKKPGVARQDGR
ncbi:MAG: HD domain-containing protein [Cenarchaeum sp. SB0677_bin_16]|nr:HD domain-containing protein [Cenarchaeum sp. SB0677_bin_16]